uniref:MFS domain-containing protein n=1 Tax=Globodera pallida TaxID=36090 RepID=A0A183C477_GLOPA
MALYMAEIVTIVRHKKFHNSFYVLFVLRAIPMPLAASMSFYALMFARMVNGLAITNLFPVVGAICTNWAPQKERGVFLAVLSGYIQLSVIISMPLTGFLADKFGWPSVFFAHSILGLTLSIWAPETIIIGQLEELLAMNCRTDLAIQYNNCPQFLEFQFKLLHFR